MEWAKITNEFAKGIKKSRFEISVNIPAGSADTIETPAIDFLPSGKGFLVWFNPQANDLKSDVAIKLLGTFKSPKSGYRPIEINASFATLISAESFVKPVKFSSTDNFMEYLYFEIVPSGSDVSDRSFDIIVIVDE